jgi:hypothetical protein
MPERVRHRRGRDDVDERERRPAQVPPDPLRHRERRLGEVDTHHDAIEWARRDLAESEVAVR